MNYVQLRKLVEPLILALKDAATHALLPPLCKELGLPVPPTDGSKRERMMASLESLTDADLPGVHLISVSKVTVRFPSNGAGMGR